MKTILHKSADTVGVCVVGSYGLGLTFVTDRAPGPGQTVQGTRFETGHGGKGSNQAVACARLGAKVDLITVIGDDSAGADARLLWEAERVKTAAVATIEGTTMVGAIVVEASGENRIVVVPGVLDRFEVEHLAPLDELLTSCDVLVVGLEIPVEIAAEALRRGRRAGVVTVLNPAPPKPLPAGMLNDVDHLVPNLHEAIELAGAPEHESPERLVVSAAFAAVPNLAITLGDEGVILRSGGVIGRVPALEVTAVDTTGAGDSFTAAYAVAIGAGCPPFAAAAYANAAAGHTVTLEQVVPALPYHTQLPDLASVAGANPGGDT